MRYMEAYSGLDGSAPESGVSGHFASSNGETLMGVERQSREPATPILNDSRRSD